MKGVSSRLLPFLLVLAMAGSPAAAVPGEAPAAGEITRLLREFLQAASRNDRAVFERFFAHDVLYTRSAGVTITKQDIMRSLDEPRAEEQAASVYDADDVTVHQYGDAAIVNFRLIAQTRKEGATETAYYRNTGTFIRRNGQWQVVAWQATRVPEKDKEKGK